MRPERFAGLAVAVFGLDMAVKQYVEENLQPGEERELGGRAVLRKVYNNGAALNLLQNRPEFLMKLSAGIGGTMLVYDALLLKRERLLVRKTGVMLLSGGAFSNIFDRLARGKVIDYIGFRTRWPKVTSVTYNIGDFAIFAGTLLAMLSTVKRTPSPGRE